MVRDVVIVGAGPAGSAAAAALARRGRDVLLLDREQFPRDKPCGDGIPPGTISILNGLGMGPALAKAGFHSIRGIRLVSPRGRAWQVSLQPRRSDADFFIAPRVAFDELVREHALACGAEFRHAAVHGLAREGNRVAGVRATVDGRETLIPTRIVIGADGATSVVARDLGVGRMAADNRAVAVRAYVSGIDTRPHTIELHWRACCAPGYAWIFPLRRSEANVGVIVRADWFKRRGLSFEDLLDEFMHTADVRARVSPATVLRDRASWQLPYASPAMCTRAFDGAMLVGDAGRFVDPLTGEGIHHAVASAAIAADVADRALDSGGSFADFDARCEKELGPLIRRSYAVQRRLAVHPALVEGVFLLAGAARGAVVRWINRVSTDFVAS